MFLANPFKFPSQEEVSKGIDHVLWVCRQEGLKYFRGPPPKPKLLRFGIAEEGCLFETDFVKNLTQKVKDAEESHFLSLNFNNMPVRRAVVAPASVCTALDYPVRNVVLQKLPRDTWAPLWKLTNLQDLRLVDNGFKKLPFKILSFTSLTSLVLRRNKLIELPNYMDKLPLLASLHVEANLITALPPTFESLTNLTVRVGAVVWVGAGTDPAFPLCALHAGAHSNQ